MNDLNRHINQSDLGFSEDAQGFTRITNPERFEMWKRIGLIAVFVAGGYAAKVILKTK